MASTADYKDGTNYTIPKPIAAVNYCGEEIDPNSAANQYEIHASHAHIVLKANFSTKQLIGHVDLTVKILRDGVKAMILDANHLTIKRVSSGEQQLDYSLGEAHPAFGSALRISLPENWAKGAEGKIIRIEYSTAPEASAIQWLPPEQTSGKVFPYLFTQCQAIHCRSLVPIQDTPSHKFPYTAEITVEKPLVALMSAISQGQVQNNDNSITYKFSQVVPMPSYLIALAIGALESRVIGPRSKVWSEKETVDAGAFEFAETEKFISSAEEIVGPYVWGSYDILLLPPSFPYGGMENPNLTFVTPTLLAGDRSLADVVAHEIAHSWFGNLVTSNTWEHFWMNEGFTVCLERKIIKALHSKQAQHLSAEIGK
jgi:leukotriene-A4 hydrolase